MCYLHSLSEDDELLLGEERWTSTGGVARASLSPPSPACSLGSGMLLMPVEAEPAEGFLLWESSVRLEEREWPVL